MKRFKRGQRGFTLIELLIVIAILGVLAAVVVPNVIGMFSRGGAQAWVTDQKTIRSAAASYYADLHQNPANAAVDMGHFWPTYSGKHNGDATITLQLVDGVTTYADVDTLAERAGTAIIGLGLLTTATDGVVGAYLDLPDSADPYNGDTTTSGVAQATTPTGTHIWYVGTDGRIFSGYFTDTAAATTINLEVDQSTFSGVWP